MKKIILALCIVLTIPPACDKQEKEGDDMESKLVTASYLFEGEHTVKWTFDGEQFEYEPNEGDTLPMTVSAVNKDGENSFFIIDDIPYGQFTYFVNLQYHNQKWSVILENGKVTDRLVISLLDGNCVLMFKISYRMISAIHSHIIEIPFKVGEHTIDITTI